jgi:hypothetical protein
MLYDLIRIDRAIFVTFRGRPTAAALRMLRADVGKARAEAGRPLVYLSLVSPDPAAFSAELRPVLVDFLKYLHTCCESVHLVIEAKGFEGTIVRSAITAIAMLTRQRGVIIHSTVEEAIASVRTFLSPAHGDALKAAVHQRLGSAAR